MRLGFIGTGTIASAVVRGLAGRGHEIRISARSKTRAEALAAAIPEVQIAGLQEILDHSEVVFLGLMVQAAPAILAALAFPGDLRVVSFMAGADLDQVAGLVAPAQATAVMMPFPGIAQGGSAIMALGDGELLEQIFAPQNTLFMLRDAGELDAYLCAQAVLGQRVSDPAQGEAFLRMLITSALAGSSADDLLEALNTPGGYNQRLRQHMEEAGMDKDLVAGLDALEG
jgi:pyrroline-5-carboxylate reductase